MVLGGIVPFSRAGRIFVSVRCDGKEKSPFRVTDAMLNDETLPRAGTDDDVED